MISVLTIGSLYWSSYQQRDGVQQCTSSLLDFISVADLHSLPVSLGRSPLNQTYFCFLSPFSSLNSCLFLIDDANHKSWPYLRDWPNVVWHFFGVFVKIQSGDKVTFGSSPFKSFHYDSALFQPQPGCAHWQLTHQVERMFSILLRDTAGAGLSIKVKLILGLTLFPAIGFLRGRCLALKGVGGPTIGLCARPCIMAF